MNETLGRLVVYLIGDGTSFQRMLMTAESAAIRTRIAVEKSRDSIQGIAGSLKNFGSSAFGVLDKLFHKVSRLATFGMGSVGVGGAAGILGLGGIAGAVSSMGWAINQASQIEQLGISFEVMLGSAGAAKKMLKDIQVFAAKTPFSMFGLKQNVQMMLNFGIPAGQVMKHLKSLGDVAGGDEQRMQGLVYAFSQVKSMGRLMGQELMQFINAGFNPLEEMSRTTGKSMMQLRTEMAAGRITFDMVSKAFDSASGAGGRFHNQMEKQSSTVKGLLSTLKDTVAIEMSHIGETIIEKLKIRDVLKKMISGAEVLAPAISHAFSTAVDWALPKIITAFNYVSGIIEGMKPIFDKAWKGLGWGISYLIEWWKVLMNVFNTAVPYFWTVVDVIKSLATSVREWVAENQAFITNLSAALAIFILLPPAIGAIGAALMGLVAAFGLLLNPVVAVPAAIAAAVYAFTEFTDAGQAAASSLTKAFGFVKEQFGLLIDLVRAGEFQLLWKVTTTSILLAWAEVVNFFQTTWIKVKTYFAQKALDIVNALRAMWIVIVEVATTAINFLIRMFNKIVPKRFEIPEFRTEGAIASIRKLKGEHQASHEELLAMQQEEMKAVQKPVDEARAAWDDAQKDAKAAQEKINKPKGGKSWVQMAFEFGGMGVDQLKKLTDPMAAEATVAGTQVGNNFTGAVSAAMGSLDAVAAGTTKAYDLLTAFQEQMKPSATLNQNITQNTPQKQEEVGLFTQIATGINTLVEQGKKGFGEIVTTAGLLGG